MDNVLIQQKATCMRDSNGILSWNLEMSENCPGCKPPTIAFPKPKWEDSVFQCHYHWSPWTSWSDCSESCDNCQTQYCKGTRNRTRVCAGDKSVDTTKCASDSKSNSDQSKEVEACNDRDWYVIQILMNY